VSLPESAPERPTLPEDTTDVLGRRIGAALVDVLVLAVIFGFTGLTIGDTSTGGGRAAVNLEGGAFLVFVALVLLYYFLGEALTGQTLGKRLLGVRVVRVDGKPAGTGPAATRTILRLVDQLPAMYLLGFIVVLATGKRRQRIGDLVAGTRVVRADGAPGAQPGRRY
jgi:uncharacterized RDD family membrane protein YckC